MFDPKTDPIDQMTEEDTEDWLAFNALMEEGLLDIMESDKYDEDSSMGW